MQSQSVFFRESGSGPSVVCLHSNASSSSQWLPLMGAISAEFHVLAADSYGAGKSPPWPADRDIALRDEVALLEPVFNKANNQFSLVGHSYGAAIALITAIVNPERVQSLVLYEPTMFALLDQASPQSSDADGIRETVAASVNALKSNDLDAAARVFIDFWSGPGAWDNLSERIRASIASSIINVGKWTRSLFTEPTPLTAFAELDVPVLLMTGGKSPRSGGAVARVLGSKLKHVETVEFDALGHMGPVTHPAIVNETILRFLKQN